MVTRACSPGEGLVAICRLSHPGLPGDKIYGQILVGEQMSKKRGRTMAVGQGSGRASVRKGAVYPRSVSRSSPGKLRSRVPAPRGKQGSSSFSESHPRPQDTVSEEPNPKQVPGHQLRTNLGRRWPQFPLPSVTDGTTPIVHLTLAWDRTLPRIPEAARTPGPFPA